MRLLLDTHCWLWMRGEPARFSERSLELLRDPGSELALSAASVWEIAIKYAAGKLRLPEPPSVFVERRIEEDRLLALPISHLHVLRAGELPPHHRDPFDRLLIAQAFEEGLTIVTRGRSFKAYGVPVLTA